MTVAQYQDAAKAPNTHNTYMYLWRNWDSYARNSGFSPMAVTPERFKEYITTRMALGDATHTARMRRTAISVRYRDEGLPDPLCTNDIKEFMAGLRRIHGDAHKQATGITAAHVSKMRPHCDTPYEIKTLAMICVMRDAMIRRSEAAALRWSDLTVDEIDGTGRLLVRRSKTDATGKGAVCYLSNSTTDDLLEAFSEEISEADVKDTIFGIGPQTISNRIKKLAELAELNGDFSGHSPRVGMAQDLAAGGASLPELMHAGRWRNPAMPAAYVRNQDAGRNAVAKYYEGGSEDDEN